MNVSTGSGWTHFRRSSYIIPIFEVGAWTGFTNQPAGDAYTIVSSSALDTGRCTIIGKTQGQDDFVFETVNLTGQTPVTSSKNNWGTIYGIFNGEIDGRNANPVAGTLTLKEASGGQVITTLAAGKISVGMVVLNFSGKDIIYRVLTGNVWKGSTLITTSNGFAMIANDARDEYISGYLFLVSDSNGATCSIDVMAN